MTHYRDDLDAARARIETLEAKVKEREAALEAREAELSEMRGEISRMQRGGGEPGPAPGADDGPSRGQRAILIALAVSGFVMASGYALMMPSSRCHGPLEVRAPRPVPVNLPMKLQQARDDDAPPPPAAGGVAFDRAAATKALGNAAEQGKACKQDGDRRRSLRVKVVFQPNGGVSSATVMGEPLGPTATSECLSETFRSARVPAFDGSPVSVTKTVRMD